MATLLLETDVVKKRTHTEYRQICVPVFEQFVAAGKKTATSDEFGVELVKLHPDLAGMGLTGLSKTIGDAFGKMNIPTTNSGYPKIYDLAKIHVVDGDLRWKVR